MKERPIIFSGESVRAILEGRKTQTRRVVKHIPALGWAEDWCHRIDNADFKHIVGDYRRFCPYGKVGDRLWVRESYRIIEVGKGPSVRYMADCDYSEIARAKWRTPMFMPKALSRIMLEIVDIRVEQVQDISEQDAMAEGMYGNYMGVDYKYGNKFVGVKEQYRQLWDSLNAKRGYPWESDPWVWVVSFKVVQK